MKEGRADLDKQGCQTQRKRNEEKERESKESTNYWLKRWHERQIETY